MKPPVKKKTVISFKKTPDINPKPPIKDTNASKEISVPSTPKVEKLAKD